MGACKRVGQAVLGANALAVQQAHVGLIVPIQAHVTTHATVLAGPKGAHKRHAAEQQARTRSHGIADKLNSVGHQLASVKTVVGHHASRKQEVEFEQVKAPLGRCHTQALGNIGAHLGVANVKYQGTGPVEVGSLSTQKVQDPLGVLGSQARLALTDKRCHPQARQHTLLVRRGRQGSHALRELLSIGVKPVTHLGKAVVHLEQQVGAQVNQAGRRLVQALKIGQQLILVDVAVVAIPAGVAKDLAGGQRSHTAGVKPGVEHPRQVALPHKQAHELVRLVCRQLAQRSLLLKYQLVLRRVLTNHRKAIALVQGSGEKNVVNKAQVAIAKTMLVARQGVFSRKTVVAAPVQAVLCHKRARHKLKARHRGPNRALDAVGPGLVPVEVDGLRAAHVALKRGQNGSHHHRHGRRHPHAPGITAAHGANPQLTGICSRAGVSCRINLDKARLALNLVLNKKTNL